MAIRRADKFGEGCSMKELFNKSFKKMGDEFFSIPNMISIFRILLIPVIVYLYCFLHNDFWTLMVIIFSTLTDIVDGIIARKCNMITDFGKFIDPVADKLTQITVFICLVTRFNLMLLPLIILVVKEVGSLLLRWVLFNKTGIVEGAHWHGKLSTGVVILIIVLHLVYPTMHASISSGLIIFSSLLMVYSGLLYTIEGLDLMKYGKKR